MASVYSSGLKSPLAVLVFASMLAIADGIGLTEEVLNRVAEQYGRRARARVVQWRDVVDANQRQPVLTQLAQVNTFFNRNRFVSDLEHWQLTDYWATPIEFLGTHGGDCEDFALAKYFTLKALNVPESKLRITYVNAASVKQAHMVLAYYATPDAEPLVLDNLIDAIKPASQRPDLEPVFSFNGTSLWTSKLRGRGEYDVEDIWEDLLTRMRRQQGASP